MFENKTLEDILAQIKAMNYLLQEVVRILQRVDDSTTLLCCNCLEHKEGETWTCPIHGVVVRTKTTL